MQKEQTESRADIEVLKDIILKRLRAVITNGKGEVAPGFEGVFDEYQQDDNGNPVLQTIAGMIMMEPEFMAQGKIHYSPNLSVDAESLTGEVIDLSDAVSAVGYTLLPCTGHYVDPQGIISYGEEARRVKRHIDTTVLLQTIQNMQNDMDSKPGLILPDTKIITR